MSTPKFPIGKAPSCGIDEYIGTDFDIVKEVADNLDVIKQAASLVGPDVTSLFTNILAKLGHNVVGSFEKGVTLTAPDQYVTYADNVYHYTGDVYPYVIEPDTKPNSDFALGYRGSVVDWDAFDRALLDWADIAYKGIPDTVDKSLRIEALDKLGLSRYWKPGDTITKVGTLVRFGDIEYQAINVPAVMGETPVGDIKFRRWTVTPDDVVPGILDQLTQLRDEAIAAAETSAAQAVSSAGSATMAKDASVVATTAATSATASADVADTSASAAILASNEAKLAANTAKEAESVVVAAEQSVSVKYDDIVLKHSDVVTKHADVVALAATVGSQAVAAGEAAIDAQQAADKAKASEQVVANNASAAQQAQVQAANSAANAALSAKGAVTSATEAANMANAAKTSAASAKTYATDAGTAASSAIAAANSVEGSEAAAAASAAAAAQSVILTDAAKTEAVNAAVEARNASESATRSASAANISAVNADNAAKSVQGIADAVLPSVEEAKGYAASAKADATIATENAVIAGNHAVTANNSIAISTAKATEALQSANTAAVSATTAVDAKDRCEEIYSSMQSGVVVRGSWDACTDAYPTDKSATARWDVIVTCGDSHVFDGKEFRNGDILYYDLGTDTFYHTPVQGVGGVVSVNGKTGTDIILTPADIGSLPATGKAVNSSLLDGFTKEDIVTESRTGLVDTVTLNTALGTKLDKTATATNSLKLEGFTKAQIIAEAQDGMAGSDVFYTKEESDARYPLDADVVKKSGSVMTGQLTVPNLVVSTGLINLTNGRLQFDSAGNTRIISKSKAEIGLYGSGLNPSYMTPDGVYYKLYHEGYLPTLEALGAFPAVGGDMDGEIIFKPTKLGDAVKNGIYFGSNTASNLAFWGDALAVYLGSLTKEVSMSGTNLKFNGKSVYYEGNEPTPAAIGALPSTGKAADSSLLDGKTKNEVIAEARTGLLTSDDVYTKTESDTRYPTKVAADAKYYSESNKPSPSTLGAVNKAGDTMTGPLVVPPTGGLVTNASTGWSYVSLKSGTTRGDVAFNNTAIEGALANSIHLRPLGNSNGSLIIQPNNQTIQKTQFGWIGFGAQNANYAHFTTSMAKFYFNKELRVAGEIYAGSGYDQRVYHTGYKPTPADIGALPTTGGTVSGHLTANNKITTVLGPSSWISGFRIGYPSIYISTLGTAGSYSSWMTQRTPSGGYSFGTLGDSFYIKYATKANIDSNTNAASDMLTMNNAGDVYSGRNHYAETFYVKSDGRALVSSSNSDQGIDISSASKNTIVGGGPSGNIYLRPQGIPNSTGQVHIAATGAVTVNGNMTVTTTYGRAGGASSVYGSIDVTGSKGGYAGINFNSVSRTFMVGASAQGIFTDGVGWQWYFSNGTLAAGTVPWARLSSVPTAATRWPTWDEVSGKPALAAANHSHTWAQISGIPQTATRWPTWSEVMGKPNVANEWVVFYNSSVKQRIIAIPAAAKAALNSGKNVRFEICAMNTEDWGSQVVLWPASQWSSANRRQVNSVVTGFTYFWIHNEHSSWGTEAGDIVAEHAKIIYAAYQIIG